MVEMVQVLVNLVIDILCELVVMVEMVQIDDKLFIFIKNEHQNKYLLMVELDENDDVEDIIAVLIAHGIEQIDAIEQHETIDGNVFIK